MSESQRMKQRTFVLNIRIWLVPAALPHLFYTKVRTMRTRVTVYQLVLTVWPPEGDRGAFFLNILAITEQRAVNIFDDIRLYIFKTFLVCVVIRFAIENRDL